MELEGLSKAVSSGSVETRPEILEGYGAGNGGGNAAPAAVAFPQDAVEVRSVVAWANDRKVKLIPVSSGRPHAGSNPRGEGFVAVDLSRMNRVVRKERRNRVAIIEPGVTFDQLQAELSKVGLRAMTPLVPRSGKSVLAAYLDRTPTLVPRAQWDLSDPLLCTEVVMGSGELFRTGCAAGPGTLEEQWATGQAQKNPMGPSAFDFFRLVQGSRGSMGIVTWASFKCELLPRAHELLMVAAESLEPLAEVVYQVARARLGEECLLLDGNALEALTGSDGGPSYALLLGVAGFDYRPDQRVSYQRKGIERIVQGEGLRLSRSLCRTGGRRILELLSTPADVSWKDSAGSHLDVYFLTTLDRAPSLLRAMRAGAASAGFDPYSIAVYVQPQVGGRVAHLEATLMFSPDDRPAAEAAAAAAAAAAAENGAYFSRPAGGPPDIAYRDRPLLVRTLRRAKKVFDPEGVLNPDALFSREVV